MAMRSAVLTQPATGEPPDPRTGAPAALDGLLGTGPCFSGALRGYDRLQVDNYVAWAEAEIALARRESDHLLTRFAARSAELADARRRLAEAARERADRSREDDAQHVLVRAAEHAAAITAAAEAEAERICEEAHAEARTRLANVAGLREAAVAVRTQAEEALAAARREQEAAEAASAAELVALRAELDRVRRQRDRAREVLRELREQVGTALEAVTAALPGVPPAALDERPPLAS
jgi:cell division septum initiation protein DivIVA